MHFIPRNYGDVLDFFAYVVLAAPDFPDRDLTLGEAFTVLTKGVATQEGSTRDARALQLLALCRDELMTALAQYEVGNGDAVRHLQHAMEWFRKSKSVANKTA
jgi:hypothetical protein